MTIIITGISLVKYGNFNTNLKTKKVPVHFKKSEIILLQFSKIHFLLKLVVTKVL